jgi:hypothetical protein
VKEALLLASVPTVAKSATWSRAKRDGVVTLSIDEGTLEVQLEGQETQVGRLRFFVCPGCGRRCRDLFRRDEETGCRKCLRLLYPDQRLGSSRWDRFVVRPARQISRINHRLEHSGLDRNHRRRLRRRRSRLLQQLENELGQRQLDMRAVAHLYD